MEIIDRDKLILMSDLQWLGNATLKLNLPNNLSMDYNNICELDNEYYYFKECDDYTSAISELIGSYLAKQIDLPAADYKICFSLSKYDSNKIHFIDVISKLFFEPGYDYFYAQELVFLRLIPNDDFQISLPNVDLNRNFPKKIVDDILKIIALDLKMGQSDRHAANIMFKKSNNGTLSLAPLYDSEYGYQEFNCYENPFKYINMNSRSIRKFAREYPQLMDYLDILSQIDITAVVEELTRQYGIRLSDSELSFFEKRDKIYTKILKGAVYGTMKI